MATHTHTHTQIKVNSLDEIIAKAREYISQGGKWKLKGWSFTNGYLPKDKLEVIIKNDKKEKVNIWCEFEFKEEETYKNKQDFFNKFIKKISKLFPIQLSEPDNPKKENKESQEPNKEKQKPKSASNDYSKNDKNDNSSIIWIVSIILLVAVGIGGMYWYFKKKAN